MGVEKFEDLIAWQKARSLASEIYLITRSGDFAKDYGFCRQIRGASVSVMANVAEGYARHSSREFAHFLSIAYASCAEVRSHLYIASDIQYIDQMTLSTSLERTAEVARLISALRTAVVRRHSSPTP